MVVMVIEKSMLGVCVSCVCRCAEHLLRSVEMTACGSHSVIPRGSAAMSKGLSVPTIRPLLCSKSNQCQGGGRGVEGSLHDLAARCH